MNGVKKFSELDPLTPNNTERIPAIQDDGGEWVNGYLEIVEIASLANTIYTTDGSITDATRTVSGDGTNAIVFDNFSGVVMNMQDGFSFNFTNPAGASGNLGISLSSNSADDVCLGFDATGYLTVIRNDGQLDTQRGVNIGASTKLDDDLVFDVQYGGTVRGSRPAPSVTQVDRDASLATPPNFTQIINGTTKLPEYYHPTFGWVGLAERSVFVQARELASLTTANPWYFGNIPVTSVSTLANREFKSPYNGKITGASIRSNAFGVAGDRSISVYVRINNTTDYLVQTVSSSSTNREFINLALNTTGIPITTSDTIVMKVVASGGTTDTTNVLFAGTLIIQ